MVFIAIRNSRICCLLDPDVKNMRIKCVAFMCMLWFDFQFLYRLPIFSQYFPCFSVLFLKFSICMILFRILYCPGFFTAHLEHFSFVFRTPAHLVRIKDSDQQSQYPRFTIFQQNVGIKPHFWRLIWSMVRYYRQRPFNTEGEYLVKWLDVLCNSV